MHLRIPDGLVLFVTLVALVLAIPSICFGTPFVWIDTVNGDDASSAPYQPNTPVRTYSRVIQIVMQDGPDTVGVKVVSGSALPAPEQAWVIMDGKKDKVKTKTEREVIAGHGVLPETEREESVDAGVAVNREFIWETFIAPNGQQAERLIGITETVEEY